MSFEPGDVVMLKSGGHSMTVVSVSDDEITCMWMTEAGQLFREAIPAITLEPIFGADTDDDEDHEDDHDHDDDHDDHDDDDDEDEEEEDEEEEEEPARKKRK